MKKKGLKVAVGGIALAAGLFLTGAPSTFAATSATTNVTQQINGGTRDVTVTPSTQFNSVTLDGTVQKTNADAGVLGVKDASGTGEGYRVTASASQFKVTAPSGGFASGTSAKTLPKGSLVLKNGGASISTVGGSTSQKPDWTANSWVIDGGSPVSILTANKDTGMGKFDVDFASDSLELTLNPSTTYIDNVNYAGKATPYETTITYTIVSGP